MCGQAVENDQSMEEVQNTSRIILINFKVRASPTIIHAVGVLAGGQNRLIPEDGQVLGNVALGRADLLDDVLDADFTVAQSA